MLFPIPELGCELSFSETVALPDGVIGVLDGQVREVGSVFRQVGPVKLGQFTKQNRQGPAVGDNVMHPDEQNMIVISRAQERQAQERTLLEIERMLAFLGDQAPQFGISLELRQSRQIDNGQA